MHTGAVKLSVVCNAYESTQCSSQITRPLVFDMYMLVNVTAVKLTLR